MYLSDVEVCNNHEQDFPSASEQHPSTNNTTYMGKASVVSVSENESTAKDLSGDGRADSPGQVVPSMDRTL